jgi:UDP-glucuronate decarboxylase
MDNVNFDKNFSDNSSGDNYLTDAFGSGLVANMLGDSATKLSGKTLLWTGTSGFLGQGLIRLIRFLNSNVLEEKCRLLAYDMRIPEEQVCKEFSHAGIIFRSHDLTTKLSPIEEKIDYVVHMAGIASPYHYKRRPLETIDVAIEGVRSTLEIARHHGAKFLFTSSSEVYQTATVIPTPETYIGAIASNNERSCYDVSKLMAENLSFVYHQKLGVDARCVRIFNSFGPGIKESDSRILPRIASAIVGNHTLSVFSGKTLPTRTYCPSGNTLAGIMLALVDGTSGEIYNIGVDGPELTVIQLIKRIEEACGIVVPYKTSVPEDVYIDEPMRRCPDIGKARKFLGYSPLISLNDGLAMFFDWALKNYTGSGPN